MEAHFMEYNRSYLIRPNVELINYRFAVLAGRLIFVGVLGLGVGLFWGWGGGHWVDEGGQNYLLHRACA